MTESHKEITVIVIVLTAIVAAFILSVPIAEGRPKRDVCNAPSGLLQHCIESDDCKLTAHEYARYTAYQNMLDRTCPDR